MFSGIATLYMYTVCTVYIYICGCIPYIASCLRHLHLRVFWQHNMYLLTIKHCSMKMVDRYKDQTKKRKEKKTQMKPNTVNMTIQYTVTIPFWACWGSLNCTRAESRLLYSIFTRTTSPYTPTNYINKHEKLIKKKNNTKLVPKRINMALGETIFNKRRNKTKRSRLGGAGGKWAELGLLVEEYTHGRRQGRKGGRNIKKEENSSLNEVVG